MKGLEIWILVAVVLTPICNFQFSNVRIVTGSSTAWRSFYTQLTIHVDLSLLQLTEPPTIFTTLQCGDVCWATTGINSHYNVDKNGFNVYVRLSQGSLGNLTVQRAIANNFVLKYTLLIQNSTKVIENKTNDTNQNAVNQQILDNQIAKEGNKIAQKANQLSTLSVIISPLVSVISIIISIVALCQTKKIIKMKEEKNSQQMKKKKYQTNQTSEQQVFPDTINHA